MFRFSYTMPEKHPIFNDIQCGNLEEVQQRVLADPERRVLDKHEYCSGRKTPLMCVIEECEPTIALWLIENRGRHDLETRDRHGWTALHYACGYPGCSLPVVQALVKAGANPAVLDQDGWTPLMVAAKYKHPDIVAFLLQQPAAKATINAIGDKETALSLACSHEAVVQLLIDAGADPSIPAGERSPLKQSLH